MKQYAKLAVALIPLLLAVGCGTKGPTPEEAPEEAVTGAEPGAPEAGMAEPLEGMERPEAAPTEMERMAEEVTDVEADLLKKDRIFFDFDRSEIKPEFRAIVEAHGAHLAANPNMTVTVEGHCDERGTREYNMALGERRAHSVMRMLTLSGASRSQIKTISFGEERPEAEGHNEEAWSQNRRAIFVYQ